MSQIVLFHDVVHKPLLAEGFARRYSVDRGHGLYTVSIRDRVLRPGKCLQTNLQEDKKTILWLARPKLKEKNGLRTKSSYDDDVLLPFDRDNMVTSTLDRRDNMVSTVS